MCIIFYVVFIKNIKHYFRGNNMGDMYTYDILNGRKSRYDRITTEDIINIYVGISYLDVCFNIQPPLLHRAMVHGVCLSNLLFILILYCCNSGLLMYII